MKLRIILALIILALGAPLAFAQAPNFPQVMPPNTVFGRLGIGAGPGQAIPFAQLGALIPGLSSANHLLSYGAKCDGTTNDDGPIAAWLAATVAVGKPAYFSGTCRFDTPIVLPNVDGVTIVGDSPQISILLYQGANTTLDVMSIGTSGVPCCSGQRVGLHFQNWQLKSNTNMTAGAAMHFQQAVRFDLLNWAACTQDCASNNFYHGVWFDETDKPRWCGVNAKAKQDVVRINGQIGSFQSDVSFNCGGKISDGQVGIRIGGAVGGISCTNIDVIANNINMLIDTTIRAGQNYQILVNPGCFLDSGLQYDIQLSDTLSTIGSPAILLFNNAWLGTSVSHCMVIDAGVRYPIYFFGGVISNCGNSGSGDGIRNYSALARLYVYGTRIANVLGTAINLTVNTTGPQAGVFAQFDSVNNLGGVNGATNGIYAQGCPAGTFVAATAIVTNGYVTKCM